MKPILIISHIACERPGYLCNSLDKQGVYYQNISIESGQPVPRQIDDIAGLVFLGSPASINDPLPWITDEIALIKLAIEADIPILGICFGAQLIAKALDSEVYSASSMQIGWHHITVNDRAQEVFGEGIFPNSFEVFEWHGDTFTIPRGAIPLFNGDCIKNQGFVYKNCLALQFHPEISESMMHEWLVRYAHCLENPTLCIQGKSQILNDISEKLSQQRVIADKLFDWWLIRVRKKNERLIYMPTQ